jgi:ABC-type bacteriocin/lantibiotic exporter with double-glycine peptidase domain
MIEVSYTRHSLLAHRLPAWAIVCAIACAPLGAAQQPRRALVDVPLSKQPYMLCLATSVSMVLEHYGFHMTPAQIADRVSVYKDGTIGRDYVKIVEGLGLYAFLVQPPFDDLLEHLEKGRPLVVTLPEKGSRHAMVLVGFDLASGEVSLNDPAAGERKVQRLDAFRSQWEKGGRWTLLIIPR